MRKLLILIFACSIFAFNLQAKAKSSRPTSASLTAKAVQLLQQHHKKKALKILEKAFQLTNDPKDVRIIGALILEATPLNYPKRSSYLRYLVHYDPDNADAPRWLKELGDKAFDEGKFNEAEDWYLRALARHPNKAMIEYRLAWVYWNQKKRVKALNAFLDTYPHQSPAMRNQVRKDVTRLWWEIGPLPTPSFKRFAQMKAADRKLFFAEFFDKTPKKHEDAKKIQATFNEFKRNKKTHKALLAFIRKGFVLADDTCFLFRSVLEPGDNFPLKDLLRCVKAKKTLEAMALLKFFDKIQDRKRTEKIDWANAELLVKADKKN